jgi:hypothetical protein
MNVVSIPVSRGSYRALVDEADYELASKYTWYRTPKGYAVNRSRVAGVKKTLRLHTLIASPQEGLEVDHKNGNRLDNRRSNLRVVSHRDNTRNHGSHGGKSQFVGVAYHLLTRKWRAYIVIDSKQFHVGLYRSEIEAAWMRDQWALALNGDMARLNLDYVRVV